jgi:hypothetical protein
MSQSSVYPESIEGRNDYYNTVQPYLVANATRLGITAANITTLNALYSTVPATAGDIDEMGWEQLWVLYANKKAGRTTAVTNATNAKDSALQRQLSAIYDDIPQSKWTATDRATLGRKGPALGHKAQPLVTEKMVTVNASLEPGGKNQLILRIVQSGGQKGVSKKKEGKPASVKEYIFDFIVQAQTTALPTTVSQCPQHVVITRLPHRMNFDPSQGGMRCCGFVETIEKPNKQGPTSAMISAIIPA